MDFLASYINRIFDVSYSVYELPCIEHMTFVKGYIVPQWGGPIVNAVQHGDGCCLCGLCTLHERFALFLDLYITIGSYKHVQYENNSTEPKNRLVLKFPCFSLAHKLREKVQHFQN